jgi:hypothetical protein
MTTVMSRTLRAANPGGKAALHAEEDELRNLTVEA